LFVLHLEPDGAYAWHTFFGSVASDAETPLFVGSVTAVNGGDVVVTGVSRSWDGPNGEGPLHTPDGAWDWNLFVLRLGPDGAYRWHTIYDGSPGTTAADGDGNLYVVGRPYSSWNGPNGESPLAVPPSSPTDGFVVLKLGANGEYVWHTFYGPNVEVADSGYVMADDIAVTGDGVYLTGWATLPWDGPNGESPLHPFSEPEGSGQSDAFVLKLNVDGSYGWHTFYGVGDSSEGPASITPNGSGGLYVTVFGLSSWDGPNGESPLHPFSEESSDDWALLALRSDGAYDWHTFLGTIWSGISNSCFAEDGALLTTGSSSEAWDGPNGESPIHGFTESDDGYGDNIFVLKLVP
jgi:hypothetical protein